MAKKCFYCGVNIDKSKDFCRCCKGGLEVFWCPGYCRAVHVRCFRKECAKKASKQGTCDWCFWEECERCEVNDDTVIKKEDFLRKFCATCTNFCSEGGYCVCHCRRR